MNRTKTPALLLLLGASCTYAPSLLANDVNCPPDLGNVTIDGNVLIAGACRMDRTTVRGNVLLYAGGSLIARGANIIGNIQADTADFVDIADTRVNGNIQLDGLVGDLSTIFDNSIGGSIQLKDNRSRLEIVGNDVNADVQAFDNLGGVVIVGNSIDGNLQCKSNQPEPAGGSNQVSGNREDQCARLQPETAIPNVPGSAGVGGAGPDSASGGSSDSSGGGSFALFGTGVMLMLAALRGLRRRVAV